MIFKRLIQLGTPHQPFSMASKTRMINTIALFTTGISGGYTLMYVMLEQYLVAGINLLFTLAYFAGLAFSYFNSTRESKLWFFVVLMIHLVICTNIYVTNESGFHLYFFLVPTGAFLLFELHEKAEKIWLSSIAVVLFFYCENTFNTAPLIVLDQQMNHMLYQSVIFVNMVEVIVVLTLFNNQIKDHQDKLTIQATTDDLTGLANRRFFFEQGSSDLRQAHVDQRPLAIIVFDLDYFKSINDKFGHFGGDICLKAVANAVKSIVREHDLLARVGGEEFAILLNDTTLNEAQAIAEGVRVHIDELSIISEEGSPISCSASFGVSARTANNDEKPSLQALLIKADKALYQAKQQGRNRVITAAQAA